MYIATLLTRTVIDPAHVTRASEKVYSLLFAIHERAFFFFFLCISAVSFHNKNYKHSYTYSYLFTVSPLNHPPSPPPYAEWPLPQLTPAHRSSPSSAPRAPGSQTYYPLPLPNLTRLKCTLYNTACGRSSAGTQRRDHQRRRDADVRGAAHNHKQDHAGGGARGATSSAGRAGCAGCVAGREVC